MSGGAATTQTFLNIRGPYASHIAMRTAHPRIRSQKPVPVRKNIWGPLLWSFLHSIGHLLGEIQDKEVRCERTRAIWKQTVNLLRTIPCPGCRKHAVAEYMNTRYTDPTDEKCDWYERWAFEFHNKVNVRLRKPTVAWEFAKKMASGVKPEEKLEQYIQSINGWKSLDTTKMKDMILVEIQKIREH